MKESTSKRWLSGKTRQVLLRRALVKTMGYTDEDLDKPIVGIINTWAETNPGHYHFRQLAEAVKRGVWAAGGFPLEVNTMSICEVFFDISSLIFRNLLSMTTEELIERHPFDGVVLMGSCDKNVPAQLMAAVSANKPAIYLPGGPMLPGNYGGDALARLMSGEANFSGKMPYTYPKEINSLVTYDYKPCEHIGKPMEGAYNYDAQVAVQWAFGYGMSYTSYRYSNLKVDKANFTADDVLTFTVDVTNTGKVAGKESVLLFSSDLVASLTPDNRRLRAFEKVELQPGETKTVTLKVKASDLAFVGYDGKWILEKGDFRIQAGDQTANIVCTATKKWESQNK